ncbi:hypothetical protein OSTOST_26027 [Ostertagia ostertagi]
MVLAKMNTFALKICRRISQTFKEPLKKEPRRKSKDRMEGEAPAVLNLCANEFPAVEGGDPIRMNVITWTSIENNTRRVQTPNVGIPEKTGL